MLQNNLYLDSMGSQHMSQLGYMQLRCRSNQGGKARTLVLHRVQKHTQLLGNMGLDYKGEI